MPSADTPREPVPVSRDEEQPMPDARRNVTVGTEGEYERSQARALYGRGNPTPPIRRGASSDRAAAGVAATVVCHAPAVTAICSRAMVAACDAATADRFAAVRRAAPRPGRAAIG